MEDGKHELDELLETKIFTLGPSFLVEVGLYESKDEASRREEVIGQLYLTISIAFAIEYLSRTSNRTMLQVSDKERIWVVHCLVHACSVGFTSGWKDFVHDNHLKIGDICFVELLNIQKYIVMNFYINRI